MFSSLNLSSRPPLLLLDFDSTLTTTSTLPTLLSLPTTVYNSRHTTSLSSNPPPLTAAQLSAAYASDLKIHDSSYLPKKSERKGLTQEAIYQRSHRPLEAASFARGRQAFSIAGVTRSDIHFAAFNALSSGEVVFRNGWKRVLSAAAKKGMIGIISTNWSKAWIESLVEIAARQEGLVSRERHLLQDEEGVFGPPGKTLDVKVWSNEVVEKADEIARSESGAPSGVRRGGLGSDEGGCQEVDAHDTPLTEDDLSRSKKRRKLHGSIDLTQALILSPKAGPTHQFVDQSSSARPHIPTENSAGSDQISILSGYDSEDFNQGDGNVSNSSPSEVPAENILGGNQTSSDWEDVSEASDSGDGHIFTSSDKGLALDSMVRSFEKQIEESPPVYRVPKSPQFGILARFSSPVHTIYIGDSPGDLEPLMAADIGIIIRNGEDNLSGEQLELKKMLGRLAITTAWIGELHDGDDVNVKEPARLRWARDFDEIVDTGILRPRE